MSDPTVEEVVALVGSHLAALHDLTTPGMARVVTEIAKFAQHLDAAGIGHLGDTLPQDAEDFIRRAISIGPDRWAEPSPSTQRVRRSAVRVLFRTARMLTLVEGDPTLDVHVPPQSSRRARPLTDEEEALGRIWSRLTIAETRLPAVWACGQASATSTEIAALLVGDVDLDNCRVWLHGNERKRDPRWGALTPWGVEQLRRHLERLGGEHDAPLLTAATASVNARQASVSNALTDILRRAGLRRDRSIRPSSLPAWRGAAVFAETGRIDDAARALGIRSLDRAAGTIGWDW